MCAIRRTRLEDIPTIMEIYRHYVLHTTYSPEITPPTIDQMTTRHGLILSKNLPHFVAVEDEGSVVGYAYCKCFEADSSFRFSAILSVYLDKSKCGNGYGRQLLNTILHEAELAGFRKMFAYIADSMNIQSIRLFHSAGFTQAGLYKSCGWKHDRWLDMIILEKSIGEGDTTPPE